MRHCTVFHDADADLVQLVDGGRDGANLVRRYTADFEDAVQDSAVVQL
jgi:hypothetical protein